MNAELENRCKELLDQGKIHATRIPSYRGTQNSWYPADMIGELQAWIASVANLFRVMATPDTYYLQECHRILEHKDLSMGVPYLIIQKLIGLLGSLLEESQRGLLRKAEYIFVASTFDDFLDRASDYHKGGKMMESSVLASAVFEDSVRKVATKNSVSQAGVALETVIDELVKVAVFTPVKAKRIKGYAAVRNKALHAQWDDFDLRDVGGMIRGTREIIETYL